MMSDWDEGVPEGPEGGPSGVKGAGEKPEGSWLGSEIVAEPAKRVSGGLEIVVKEDEGRALGPEQRSCGLGGSPEGPEGETGEHE
jgi:hypothetical protein